MAVVAVAAHLSQHNLGERYGLPALAKRYKQDVDALEQVGAGAVGWWWVVLCALGPGHAGPLGAVRLGR